jgi:hypothetical protein
MVKVNEKLKAATLLESIIAMIVIVLCLGIGTMIFVNVLHSDKDKVNLEASLLLNTISKRIQEERIFIDGETIENGYRIQSAFIKYPETENLLQLNMKAFDQNNKLIQERIELIITE